MSKDLKYYLSLDYPVQIVADPEGGFVASIADLPGCYAFGETQAEALTGIEDSKQLWLESHFEEFGEAPEPRTKTDFSGKLLLRIPKCLHESLYTAAKAEGVSLNQYLGSLLAERNAYQRLGRLIAAQDDFRSPETRRSA